MPLGERCLAQNNETQKELNFYDKLLILKSAKANFKCTVLVNPGLHRHCSQKELIAKNGN